jgi:hypothetical protein
MTAKPLTIEELEIGKIYRYIGHDRGDLFFGQDAKLVGKIGLGVKAQADEIFDVVEVQRLPIAGTSGGMSKLGRIEQVHAAELAIKE